MTTELVLLIAMFAFITGGAFFNKTTGPFAVFESSGPRLGARIEHQLTTGRGFKAKGQPQAWVAPDTKPPTGQL